MDDPEIARQSGSTASDDPRASTVTFRAPSSPEGHAFQAGQVVASRYRIVRFISQGAMGEVYEAEHLELHQRIALKTIHRGHTAVPAARERFRREILLARQVTHANVCRTFDLEQHVAPPEAPLPFLTMELLQGETLSAYLRRRGVLPLDEALALARQMADALDAAHRAGVVHRDFKPGNVMVVPGKTGLRAVVTDFGVASLGGPDDAGLDSITEPGTMIGTPAYMSPEQIAGLDASSVADIYALGIILYEMVTGKQPFPGRTSISRMAQRLTEPPVSPRVHAPTLDPRWEHVILRCLERDPAARFPSAGEAVAALEAGPRRLTARRRRGIATIALVVLGLGLGAAGLSRLRSGARAPAGASASARRSVAVLGFKNLSSRADAAWLADAFAELLDTELAAGEELRVVAGETVSRVKVELAIGAADSFAPEALARVRRNLDADLVLVGSYVAVGTMGASRIRLDVRLQDTERGETVARLSEEGGEAQLLEIVARTGARLREKLGVGVLSETAGSELRAARPGDAEAASLYTRGVAQLRLADPLAARDLLVQAIAADPGYALAHSALSAAWTALGYDERAVEEARQAFDRSSSLPRGERLDVEGRYRASLKDWDGAAECYRRLWALFPDELEHGLRLAEVQTLAGRGRDALVTIDQLRQLVAAPDPRVDLAEASAAAAISDYRRELEAAGRAAGGAQDRGARLLLAQARLEQWRAHRLLGELDEAIAAADEARKIYAAAEHRAGVALALSSVATVKLDQGKLDEAYASDTESLRIFREIGDRRRVAWALNNLARVLRTKGRLSEALQRYQESLAICREIDDKSGLGRALANTGRVLWEQGRLIEARTLFDESLALRRDIGEKRGIAGATLDVAFVLWRQGRLDQARTLGEQARDLFTRVGDRQSLSYASAFVADVLTAEDRLPEARALHEEALAIRRDLRLQALVSDSRLALAELTLEEGHPDEAVRAARDLVAEPLYPAARSRAQALLARALLARGQEEAAREAAERAEAEAKNCELVVDRFAAEIAALRVRAALSEKKRSGAIGEDLARIEKDASDLGLTGVALEARLARGEVEMSSGSAARGRPRLLALRTEASAAGFALLARKATQELGGTSQGR
jgi:tetratricopeptide (TPR) repeat protein/tRNA A-37 threonylcarbamoyl transferase component Bud32